MRRSATSEQALARMASTERLIKALLAVDEGLTEWEVGFAESIARQFEKSGYLTAKQIAKAESILEELGQ